MMSIPRSQGPQEEASFEVRAGDVLIRYYPEKRSADCTPPGAGAVAAAAPPPPFSRPPPASPPRPSLYPPPSGSTPPRRPLQRPPAPGLAVPGLAVPAEAAAVEAAAAEAAVPRAAEAAVPRRDPAPPPFETPPPASPLTLPPAQPSPSASPPARLLLSPALPPPQRAPVPPPVFGLAPELADPRQPVSEWPGWAQLRAEISPSTQPGPACESLPRRPVSAARALSATTSPGRNPASPPGLAQMRLGAEALQARLDALRRRPVGFGQPVGFGERRPFCVS